MNSSGKKVVLWPLKIYVHQNSSHFTIFIVYERFVQQTQKLQFCALSELRLVKMIIEHFWHIRHFEAILAKDSDSVYFHLTQLSMSVNKRIQRHLSHVDHVV